MARERIVRVPERQQQEALRLLGARTFSLLARSQVDELLAPDPAPDAESLLARQAEDAEKKAEDCREFAARTTKWRDRALQGASEYEKYAAYTRSLPLSLRPYLVKTKVLFEGTGAYDAYLKGHRLAVRHLSLGRGPREPTIVAVIVFVETDVDGVDVSFSAAE